MPRTADDRRTTPCWSWSTSKRATATNCPTTEVGIEIMPGGRRADRRPNGSWRRPGRGIPVVFFQEVHRRSGIDFGRELDGAESVHCLDGQRATELVDRCARPARIEFHIVKRRYSGFIGTEFEIVLRGAEGRDADPHRRPHRRLRALHVRRRPPARLLRPGRLRLCRRFERGAPRRIARRHGVPAGRCRPHHRRDHRRLR